MMRVLILLLLSAVAALGALLSKFGRVGQDLREWALERQMELR